MPVRSAWLINRTETETGQSRADTRLSPVGTMAPNGALSSTGGVIPGSMRRRVPDVGALRLRRERRDEGLRRTGPRGDPGPGLGRPPTRSS